MEHSTVPANSGLKVRVARKIIQAYGLKRGKDRLYLILRSLLRIPQHVVARMSDDVILNLNLDDYLQRWTFCHRLRDEVDFFWMSKILTKGDVFVDVGAHIGVVSLLAAAAVGESGRVFAIEALPDTRKKLEDNIRINRFDNITVLPFALLDENRDVPFFASIDGNTGGSSLSDAGIKAESVMVTGRTFDSLMHDGVINRCDVLKMDIEGAEILALRGMKDLFAASKPRAVLIEIVENLLSQFGGKPSDILAFFRQHGYVWYSATPNGFAKFSDSEMKDFNNLWAIQPGKIEAKYII